MSKWAEKQVVGLGGNAGTGKDAVLQMLVSIGAYTIDVDEVADRVVQKGAPAYLPVLESFGGKVLDPSGQIDRNRLYDIVRSDRRARNTLQSILDPLVLRGVISLINTSKRPVIVIKSDDLQRYGLIDLCDRVWVTVALEEVQIANLVRENGWSEIRAREFVSESTQVNVQLAHADLVFYNKGSRGDLLRQVSEAWESVVEQQDQEVEIRGETEAGLGFDLNRTQGHSRVGEPESPPSIAAADSISSLESDETRAPSSTLKELKAVGGRILNLLLTLLVIAYLTSWGLILAERGRERLPAQPLQAAWQALLRVGDYFINHPQTYYWHRENIAALQLVTETLRASAGLLLLALGVALLAGLPLGIAAAFAKRKTSSTLIMVISTLGISTPSFLFAMFLWVANIWVHRTFDVTVLPSTGFGWDAHLIMPALVLAMRPLAQIAQVTHVSMRDILGQDYIRTALSKGLSWRLVRNVHALPNILIPTLSTLGSSLRFSLASLPVVELFFDWPGVGSMLLDAIQEGNGMLVTDLILSLGLFFLFVNFVIEFTFPLIDARLRSHADMEERNDQKSLLDWLNEYGNMFSSWLRELRSRFTPRTSELPPLPSGLAFLPVEKDQVGVRRGRWYFRNFLSNPAFVLGSVMLLALLCLVLLGESLTAASPYQIHGVMMVEGEIGAPPYKPSSVFPWGTDHIGRDIQALVLAGGKRTLTLAFFGMLARLFLGTTLGIIAGWQRGSWIDRLVTGAVGVWAAFPITLFAMIIIQALGIQQGMWVFVVALSVVGWGEVAQFVRGQVIALKPQLFIDAARSVGSRTVQILGRHVIPNLVNSLIVLAVLEMGGILMLLAELGYLNIFLGGGFRAMLGEAGRMVPIIATYSDVPEWSAMIANVRQHWRSYPWMAIYPGLAVFLSIMSFNLFGEGLRRFLDDTHANLSRLFNRYTFIAAVMLTVVVALVLQASTPLSQYRVEGLKFDKERVMRDVQILSSAEMQGRETGMPGADLAALYIAYRF